MDMPRWVLGPPPYYIRVDSPWFDSRIWRKIRYLGRLQSSRSDFPTLETHNDEGDPTEVDCTKYSVHGTCTYCLSTSRLASPLLPRQAAARLGSALFSHLSGAADRGRRANSVQCVVSGLAGWMGPKQPWEVRVSARPCATTSTCISTGRIAGRQLYY